MAHLDKLKAMVTKELHFYYLLDVSYSMKGAPIAALNDAMRSTINELIGVDESNANAVLRVGVLQFSDDASWVTVNADNEPVVSYLKDLLWRDLQEGGQTSLGAALRELNRCLSKDVLQKSEIGNWTPIVVIMSDGMPTDDWKSALKELNRNSWYEHAIKIAFALGDNADIEVLGKVVGTTEAVLQTNDLEAFKRAIRIVSVATSIEASTPNGKPKEGKDAVKQVGGRFAGKGRHGETVIPQNGLLSDPKDIYAKAADGAEIGWAADVETRFDDIDFENQRKFA